MTQLDSNPLPHPDASPLTYHRGNIVCDPGCMEAALDAYEQAIQFVPREASFYYHKGHILEQLGRLAEAKCAYEQAKRLGYNG